MWSDQIRRSGSGLGYRRAGEGAAVLLLHGIPGSARAWRSVAARFDTGVDVVVPDLLGFGTSDRPRGLDALHASAQAAAVEGLLDEIGAGPVTVVGHDFGGPVALLLAARRPGAVAAVGLFATNAFADTPIPFPLSAVTWPLLGPVARRLLFSPASLRMMLSRGTGPGVRPPDLADHLGDADQQAAIATIFGGSLTHLEALYGPVEAQLLRLDVPVIVGWGDRDPFFPVDQGKRTASAAGGEFRLYAGAGHFLPHERPDEVAAAVAALAAVAR